MEPFHLILMTKFLLEVIMDMQIKNPMPLAVLLYLLLIGGVHSNPGPTFTCKFCKLSYPSVSDYCTHVKVHLSLKTSELIPCCWCDQSLKRSSFESHISRFHNDQRGKNNEDKKKLSLTRNAEVVQCPVCHVDLDTRKEYMQHMSGHIKDKEYFTCSLGRCKRYSPDTVAKFQSHMCRYHPVRDEDSAPSTSAQDFDDTETDLSAQGLIDPEPSTSSAHADAEDNFCGTDNLNSEDAEDFVEENNLNDESEVPDVYPENLIKDEMGLFYLKLESKLMLPTEHVQAVSQEIKLITELSHHSLKKAMRRELKEAGADPAIIDSIVDKTFKSDPIFNLHHKHEDVEHLGTHHLRDKFWRKRFPFVTPTQVKVGTDDSGKSRYAQLVSIRETLSILLRDSIVKQLVHESFVRKSKDGVFQDYCDGSIFKEHIKQHPEGKCIQLLLFQDAFDANAFTAAAGKFKPVGFYYSVGNLSPEYRSKVDLIQLAFLILEKDLTPSQQEELTDKNKLKFAIQILLDEIEDLRINGITIDGVVYPVCLLYLIGDSLGQHQMGGYVRSFSCEFFCRFCPMSRTEFKEQPHLTLPLRTPTQYNESVVIAKAKWTANRNKILTSLQKKGKQTCRREEFLHNISKPEMKKVIKKNISKDAYKKLCAVSYKGVKYRASPFNSNYFHVSDPSMPPCIGHDIFEGCVKLVLAEILKHFVITKKWFDFDTLNRRIKTFKCKGLDSRDSPCPLKNFDKLSGSAVEIWNLVRLLPFMIGDLIEDEEDQYWQLYLSLKEIIEFICAPKITQVQIGHLQVLLTSYLQKIKELLPGCLIPKHHFVAHYPELIMLYGPLVRLFTLRFESKHMFFKEVIRTCKNYVNITYTMAKKYMCEFAFDHSKGIIPPVLQYHSSFSVKLSRDYFTPEQQAAFTEEFNFSDVDWVDRVTLKSIQYDTGDVLIIDSEDGVHLNVGYIEKIVVLPTNKVLFLLEQRSAVNSFSGYFIVKKSSATGKIYTVKSIDELPDYYSLPLYEFCGQDVISLKHSATCLVRSFFNEL